FAVQAQEKFEKAMADDLNTPSAIAALFELVRDLRPLVSAQGPALSEPERVAARVGAGVISFLAGEILGVLRKGEAPQDLARDSRLVDGLIRLLVEVREEARKARDFARADYIRDRMKELGVALEDTAEGTRWTVQG